MIFGTKHDAFLNLLLWLTECTQSESKEVEEKCIEKGDIIDLNDFLFTKTRDYLVKNNNQQVCTCVSLRLECVIVQKLKCYV